MSKFIFAYHGGRSFETREEGAAHMAKWNRWIEGLGEAVVEPGIYFGKSKTVDTKGIVDGGGANPISGITIVQADTIEAALEMATVCPHVGIGGSIEVAEAHQM